LAGNERSAEQARRRVLVGRPYKVVAHEEGVGFFSGNRLWKTLLNRKRFATSGIRRYGGQALENAHRSDI
jgi:hypothetical protein